MGYISGSGTGCAAPTGGSAASRMSRRLASRLGAAALLFLALGGATPVATLDLGVSDLRSAKGSLRICLTKAPDNFPSCIKGADAVRRSVPAGERDQSFDGLPPGDYAIAIIHDENNNGKLDTVAGIPREGFGFSRNPPIGFGAPRFRAARFTIAEPTEHQQVRMRYLL